MSDIIPNDLKERLKYGDIHDAVARYTTDIADITASTSPVFFAHYTRHDHTHIYQTLVTARQLIPDDIFEDKKLFTPADAACLCLATVLHDAGMHLTQPAFRDLINTEKRDTLLDTDKPWRELWDEFINEAIRFDDRTLRKLHGDKYPANLVDPAEAHGPDQKNDNDVTTAEPVRDVIGRAIPLGLWNNFDNRVIGEFLRRHHPRLAHEIAIIGIPRLEDAKGFPPLIEREGIPNDLARLAGFVARSHGMPMRKAADFLKQLFPPRSKRQAGAAAVYHMALLRIADYLQITAARAPATLYHLHDIQSLTSIEEWNKHAAVQSVDMDPKTPSQISISITPPKPKPHSLRTHLQLRQLFDDIQRELDSAAGVLDEKYGNIAGLQQFSLAKSRIVSDLDEDYITRDLPYLPEYSAFSTAGPELLRLLIRPLYGDRPDIGIRELIQNAADAVRELEDILKKLRDSDNPEKIAEAERIEASRRDLGVDKDGRAIDVRIEVDHTPDPNDPENEDAGEWTLTCTDRGVGMTADTIRNYYLKAGASFRNSPTWRSEHQTAEGEVTVTRAGRFGIGAFASFLLADMNSPLALETRHFAGRGLAMNAALDTDPIELHPQDTAQIGTRVRLLLTRESINSIAKEQKRRWGASFFAWHAWNDICVAVNIRGDAFDHESLDDQVDPVVAGTDRTAQESAGQTIRWDWRGNRGFSDTSDMTLNGISIRGGYSANLPDWGGPFPTPRLAVHDPHGSTPLTTKRENIDAMLEDAFPSTHKQMLFDSLAHLMVYLPTQATGSNDFPSGPASTQAVANLGWNDIGWFFSSFSAGEGIMTSRQQSLGIVCMPCVSTSAWNKFQDLDRHFQRYLRDGYGIVNSSHLPASPDTCVSWLSERGSSAPGFDIDIDALELQRNVIEFSASYHAYAFAQPTSSAESAFNLLCRICESLANPSDSDRSEPPLLAIHDKEVQPEKPQHSPFFETWLDVIGRREIPFDLDQRRDELDYVYRDERVAPYIKLWQDLKDADWTPGDG